MATLILAPLTLSVADAAEWHYLKKSEIFCDTTGILCLDGTLSYEPNSRVVNLRARVQKQTVPGALLITLTGTNRQGHPHYSEIGINIRGDYSEIVDHQMRPDAPDVDNWLLSSMTFKPHAD